MAPSKQLTNRGKGGRPTKLTQQARAPQGTPGDPDYRPARTVADVVIEHLRTGAYMEESALAAGVTRASVYTWIQAGAAAHAKAAAGGKLTAAERRHAEFLDAVEEAQAVAEISDVARLARLAAGVTTTKRQTKTRAGVIVEEVTTVEEHLPNAQVIEWRLERRHSSRWGRREALEVSGPDGGPIEVAPTLPREEMLTRLARLKAEQDELAARREQRALGPGEAASS